MNCSDVRRVLDEHGLSALTAAERLQFDAHLTDCDACYAEVSAQRLLLNEASRRPRPGLLHTILASAPEAEAVAPVSRAPFGWPSFAGLAAAAALVLLIAGAIFVSGPGDMSPDPTATQSTTSVIATDASQAPRFVEGEHYVALPAAGRFSDLGGRISAWIYFMWSCLHCYELESLLPEWVARQDPSSVEVVKVPVAWNEYAELHARAFYTASVIGRSAEVSDAFFAAIHEQGNYLDTRQAIRALFVELGVDGAVFDSTFDSERVDDLLSLARFNAAEARIDATPTMVIGGVYKTSPVMAGSQERMLQVAGQLIAQLRSNADPSPACDLAEQSEVDCR